MMGSGTVISSRPLPIADRPGGEGCPRPLGTGAVASAYVARRRGLTGDRVVVRTAGGDLRISFAADGVAFMAGGAVRVYEGTVEI